MRDAPRSCSRPGCPAPADASLSYRYASGQVWLADLSPSPHPALYDLCASHADTLTVPRGWQRVDQRSAMGDRFVTFRRHPAPAARPAPPEPGDLHRAAGVNRYERLRRELPALAAQGDEAPAGRRAPAVVDKPARRRSA